MTHTSARVAALLLLGMFGLSGYAAAVSYPVIEDQREEKAAKGIRVKGETVCLFQSGTADVKKAINANDILPVYRESKSHELKEVGKIKVLTYIGEDYLKGEVVEGEIQAGDIVKKGKVASLVILSGDKCK